MALGDVSTAFLHAPLGPEDHVYLQPPPNKRTANVVWRLHKALYGLRAAPRLFQEHMARVLEQGGFRRGIADPQLYWHPAIGALVSIHADDIPVTAKREDMMNIQALMTKQLVIKWTEEITEKSWVRYVPGPRVAKDAVWLRGKVADALRRRHAGTRTPWACEGSADTFGDGSVTR